MLASQIEASGKLSRKGLAKVMQQLQADHDAEEIDLDSLTEEQLRELSKVALDPSYHNWWWTTLGRRVAP